MAATSREPAHVRSATVASESSGAMAPASSVSAPSTTNTAAPASMTPAPSVVAIMAQKTRSIIDLVSRMLLSPRMPASSEPLTAMAPTQHSRLAVTKPSASDGPPSCRCTCASTQVPRRWMAPSTFSSAPTAAPSVMDTMTMRMLRHSIAPEMPIYSTHSPRPIMTVLLTRSGMPRRNSRPTAPPATMASALTMAPVMLMNDPLLPPRPPYLNKVSPGHGAP